MIYNRLIQPTSKHSIIYQTPRYVGCAQYTLTYIILTIVQEPKLWYGIGILYDRYGSLEHAEEAFSQVMRMEPNFEKANEIYFRLGIIYKQQQKFNQSLDVSPANPLLPFYILIHSVFQIHCHEPSSTIDRGGHMVSDWPCL
jgi:tetratricopeptide (TPR) repeat protein